MRLIILPFILLLVACGSRGPRAIAYGSEPCQHCHMTIADPRYSAELLTRTGKALTFDDIGCMAAWLDEHPGEKADAWVVSLVDGKWIPADSATYLRSETFHTPMASGLVALRSQAEADSVRRTIEGETFGWSRVRRDAAGHGHTNHSS